jgi:uncharacterized protein
MEPEFNPSAEEIARACQGKLPLQVVQGLELFNQGEYFEAHEVLELAWREEAGPVRELYRGILQIAVAYYHILRQNYPGAVKMFQRSRAWLAPFPDRCQGIDLAKFRLDYARVEESLLRLGPQQVASFDRSLMKPIQYTEQEEEK